MQRSMLLVCHAADGHFANGNREAVRRLLARAACEVRAIAQGRFSVKCLDGGQIELVAPGLDGTGSFRRAELRFSAASWTDDVLHLVMSLMRVGGFGLLDDVNAPQILVASPEHLLSFPWLPEPPRLVRSVEQLALALDHPVTVEPALAALC